MNPLLIVRSLYHEHFRRAGNRTPQQMVSWLAAENPADVYVYGHLGYHENTVAALRDAGKIVVRYLWPTRVRPEAAGYAHTEFDRVLHDVCDRYGMFLTNGAGERLRWFAYPQQDGQYPYVVDWSKASAGAIAELTQRVAFVRGPFELDCFETRLKPWMIRDAAQKGITQEKLDQWHDPAGFTRNLQLFASEFKANVYGPERDRHLFLNSNRYKAANLYDEGGHVFFEDWSQKADDEEMFRDGIARWVQRPGCVIEAREPSTQLPPEVIGNVWRRINLIMDAWVTNGGWLWIDNENPNKSGLLQYALARQAQARA